MQVHSAKIIRFELSDETGVKTLKICVKLEKNIRNRRCSTIAQRYSKYLLIIQTVILLDFLMI